MMYTLIHFLHVLGALGMAAAFAVEAAGLVGLRRSITSEEARSWLRTRRWMLTLGPPSIGLLLATGIYASVAGWGWAGWIAASLGGLLLVAVIGGVLTGIPMARVEHSLEHAMGALPEPLRDSVRSPVLMISMTMRGAITVAIVLLMVSKPGALASIMAIGIAAGVGVGLGFALGRSDGGVKRQPT